MSSAIFLGTDTATQGTWIGVYGDEGYSIPDLATSAPTGVTITVGSHNSFTFNATSVNTKAVQYPNASNRIESVFFNTPEYTFEVTPGEARKITLYFWDVNADGRVLTVSVYDHDGPGGALQLVETRTVSGFSATPVHLSWTILGKIKFTVTHTAGTNAILNAYFVDTDTVPTQTGVFVAGANGTVKSTMTALFNMDGVTRDVSAEGSLVVGGSLGAIEQTTPPTAITNMARIFAEDDGSGKTRLMVQFGSGAAQQLSIEP
jgi:hypothetical protein